MSHRPSYPNIDMKQTGIRIKHIVEAAGYTPSMIGGRWKAGVYQRHQDEKKDSDSWES